jgi:hypothetical protein
MNNQRHDWIWFLSMVAKYCQTHDKNDTKAIDVWNWAIECYQPDEFDVIEVNKIENEIKEE